ncbi:hypothetical protein LCGC14_2894100 [marine sediment metagenome]|uniref:C2H2-type domain-containing protein n=1 Tax=marine sediment metagenome TaxID=412755 RepID=A0A0F9AMK0_9ZZZZ
MDRYDIMAGIPPSIEKKAFRARQIQRALAARSGEPYCFKCDQRFGSHEALEQHRRAKHVEATP